MTSNLKSLQSKKRIDHKKSIWLLMAKRMRISKRLHHDVGSRDNWMILCASLDQSSENRRNPKQEKPRVSKFNQRSTERPLKRTYKSVKVKLETRLEWIPIKFDTRNNLHSKGVFKKLLIDGISSTYNPVNTVDCYIEPLNLRVSFSLRELS